MTELDRAFSIQDLKDAVAGFYQDRSSMNDYNKQPLFTEMALVIESAEVLEQAKFGLEIGPELADVLLYVMCLAIENEIDLTSEVLSKLAVNATRFPVDVFTGTAEDFPRQYKQRKTDIGERKWGNCTQFTLE